MKQALLFRQPLPQKKHLPDEGEKKRVIVIAGPTAVGKTQLSLSLSKAIGGEIVSADSMQVYRGMDIGTAKASPEERAVVPHHMIDICDLDEPFNVAEFYHRTQDVFCDISLRDNVPIVVGGSGFYVHALLYGPPAGPPSSPDVRDLLERQMRELGPEILFERLQMLDPVYAETISERDRHKIIRALEIIALTDRKVSEIPKADQLQEQDYDFRCWFIYYPRDRLYSRIELRCDQMIQNGFLNEVKRLEERGLKLNSSASQAIGYRQALDYLQSAQTEADFYLFTTQFKKASRQYAKRQFTWFRKEPIFRWLNIDELGVERLKELILQDFEQGI